MASHCSFVLFAFITAVINELYAFVVSIKRNTVFLLSKVALDCEERGVTSLIVWELNKQESVCRQQSNEIGHY